MRAFVVERRGDEVAAAVRDVDSSALLEGDVEVAVEWSCLNFKDSMVVRPGNRVARRDLLIGGVDAAGTVIAPSGPWRVGDRVIAQGHGFGTSHHGGFASQLRCDASWLTPLPEGLDPRTAMAYGTAGYTAMASIVALERTGLTNDRGDVLVTGASGGVGSTAVALLAARGFAVTAMTGKADEHAFLRGLGATEVVGRDALDDDSGRVLGAERFAGAIDCVGGETLGRILRVLRWGAAVAASGLVGGTSVESTVYPFITRNVALLGIDSVLAPAEVRAEVWDLLACALEAPALERLVAREVGLDGIAAGLEQLDRGEARGRVLVDPRR